MKDTWNYIIGDIHGCFDEYIELEKKIHEHSNKNNVKPIIISVGDLIDRGPASDKVVNHFLKGQENGTHITVMGNHELCLIEVLQAYCKDLFKEYNIKFPKWIKTYDQKYKESVNIANILPKKEFYFSLKKSWLFHGGSVTLKNFGFDHKKPETWNFSEKVIKFLINLPIYWENDNLLITHALPTKFDISIVKEFFALKKIEQKKYNMNIFNKSMNKTIWNRVAPKEKIDNNKINVSGHTPIPSIKKVISKGYIQIDTGCVYGGSLTAWCNESDETLSVNAYKKYA